MKLLDLISYDDKLEAVKHIETVLVEFSQKYVGTVIKKECDVKPDEQELHKFSKFGEYFEKDINYGVGDSVEVDDIKPDIELLMHDEINVHKEIKTDVTVMEEAEKQASEGCFSGVQNTVHQKVTEQVNEQKVVKAEPLENQPLQNIERVHYHDINTTGSKHQPFTVERTSRFSVKLSLQSQKAEQKLDKNIDEQISEEVNTDNEPKQHFKNNENQSDENDKSLIADDFKRVARAEWNKMGYKQKWNLKQKYLREKRKKETVSTRLAEWYESVLSKKEKKKLKKLLNKSKKKQTESS